MKFVAIKENLKEGVLLAEKTAGRRTALPVLSSILCSAEKGKITLTATNLETAVEVWVGGRIEKEGKAAIPARVLSSYMSVVAGDQITCSVKGNNVEFASSAGRTVMRTLSADDFPLIPRQQEIGNFSVGALAFKDALRRVSVAAALSDIRPELSSVCVAIGPKKLTLAATDSFRLAEEVMEGSFGATDAEELPKTFLLPIKSAQELTRLLEAEPGDVTVSIGAGQVVCSTKRFRMVSRLTEGAFPEYKSIIPSAFTTTFELSKESVMDMLRVAGLFVGKLHDVTFHVVPAENHVEVRTVNADVGENKTRAATNITGEGMEISFDYRYIMDGLQQMDGDLMFQFASSAGPLLVRPKNNPSYFYIVMPMKV
jgi:DNA polymerase III subunit beta